MGVGEALLYRWKSEIGRRSGSQSEEVNRLKKQVAKLTQDNEILKKCIEHIQPERIVLYGFIQQESKHYPVAGICRCLCIGTSSYYEFRNKAKTKVLDQEIERKVISVFWSHKRRYGTRRIVSELSDCGVGVGRDRVGSILRRNNLKAIQPRSYVPRTTTSSKNGRSPNLLLNREPPVRPNEVWVGESHICQWLTETGHI